MHSFRHMSAEGRRWMLWGVHLVVYFGYIGWMETSEPAPFGSFSKVIAMVWLGLLTLHFLWIGFAPSSNSSYAEKSKRHQLELSDDGELVEIMDEDEKPKHEYGG